MQWWQVASAGSQNLFAHGSIRRDRLKPQFVIKAAILFRHTSVWPSGAMASNRSCGQAITILRARCMRPMLHFLAHITLDSCEYSMIIFMDCPSVPDHL